MFFSLMLLRRLRSSDDRRRPLVGRGAVGACVNLLDAFVILTCLYRSLCSRHCLWNVSYDVQGQQMQLNIGLIDLDRICYRSSCPRQALRHPSHETNMPKDEICS
ncbi:uncharacterized protein K452DRAFT_63796 [Aplosporella prunicola CBS 121167]|uniref:Uncharacterized protein n=1 Tax=Aplosporella prunicola CBS 121167 TaxID=1176127 RepID=A0A6A6B8H8_9PEZI|nr:uncharacterized protein K452DRAFT_63796 [Aplosporella prunicola CBS 121167]KAF2139663.1 hypothetical protein K452DRAFT_63796 [Aplosporella prunicola CBS 121167]